MGQLGDAEVDPLGEVPLQVAEDDPPIGRRGHPAGRRPDDPTDSVDLGACPRRLPAAEKISSLF